MVHYYCFSCYHDKLLIRKIHMHVYNCNLLYLKKNLILFETDPITEENNLPESKMDERWVGNWGKRRKAPNVQRLQIIVRLLFHTNLTTKILREDARFQQIALLQNFFPCKVPVGEKGVNSRAGAAYGPRGWGKYDDARLAIISLVQRRTARMQFKPDEWWERCHIAS